MFSKIVVFLLLKQGTYGCKRENIVASHVAALPVEVLGFDNRLVTHSELKALGGVLNMHEYIYIPKTGWKSGKRLYAFKTLKAIWAHFTKII